MLKYLGMMSTTYFQMGGVGEVGLCTVERDTISMTILMNIDEEFKDILCTGLSAFLYQKIKLEEKLEQSFWFPSDKGNTDFL